ncbi:MAG TPA: EAL domain-containing protein [Rhodoferax sp.]|nr:EAL domain-containing protein [Rhodoferax sp.]
MTESDTFADLFAPEPESVAAPEGCAASAWKVLLVDDEKDIHAVLNLALRDMRVEGKPLELLDAHSATEAKQVLADHPDISLILLDVVMESELAGLNLVRHIRRDICNRMVQIVLVTGQPGYAPQREVVTDYEIDGYRLKSELTADKIFVSVYVALRTYKALRESELQRQQVESMAQVLSEKEQRLRSVVNTAPDAIIQANAQGTVIGWNEGASHLFGYSSDEMLGQSINRLMPERLNHVHDLAMGRLRAGAPPHLLGKALELVGLRKDGSEFPIELVLGSWATVNGPHYSAVIRDISERKRSESGLRLAASVYANSYEGIIITDPDKTIVDVNPAFTRITGYSRDEVLGRTPKLLSSGKHDAAFYKQMWSSIAEHDFWQGEICNRRSNAELYTEILSLSVIRDSAGKLQHYIGVFSDISLLKAHEEELYRIAHFDMLTGVPNRRLLLDRLSQALLRTRRTGRSVAVCYMDLDGFKLVNDRFGHDGGDKLLVEMTKRLRMVLRTDDTLGRLGGDEFVLLLTDLADPQESQLALDRVLEIIKEPIEIAGQLVVVSASVGVTVYPADEADADVLLRHADQAMYLAKETGKNSYHYFDPLHDRQVQTQRHYMQRLREALDHDEFVLFFQPKANLRNGDIVGFEALIRWQHPQRGLLAPAEFLHFMDGSELEVLVGEWVIDTVLRQLALWSRAGIDSRVSANVSADHLLRDNFAQRLRLILERYPEVAPERLELEILETAALADMKRAVETITQCRNLGVQFALDDFGTGYSSLTYFLNLPVQLLKIDQSFVRMMLEDPGGLGIVESVVRLAQAFNRPVIAEGVETLEHGSMLLYFGCYLAQGYGISRPMPADQVGPWLQAWKADQSWRRMVTPAVDQDVTLQVAAQSHRAWVDKVTRQVTQLDGDSIIEADSSICSFGRWYRGSGVTRYGSAPQYKDIAAHHERGHELAGMALTLAKSGKRREADLVLQELYESCDSMVALLKKLISKPAIWR